MVLIQVGQRYVPHAGIPPTGELARLSMVWATFVLSGYLMAHDRHIAIHVVDYFLPIRVLGFVQLHGQRCRICSPVSGWLMRPGP